jgi:predicted nuclease with TOPRIM domain
MHCKRKFYHLRLKLEKEKKIKDEQLKREEHDQARINEYLNRKKAIATEMPILETVP